MPLTPPATQDHYFNLDFFSPFYFAPLGTSQSPGAPELYFATEFYTPFYFPPLIPVDVGSIDVDRSAPYRDGDAFAALAAALEATGEFGAVFVAASADRRPGGAGLEPVAVLSPEWWEEVDDADPTVVVRHVAYALTLVVRDEDPFRGFDRLDRLTCAALNAIDGSDLGGGSIPALTRLRRGTFDQAAVHPEHRVVLQGELTYLIPSPTSHCD